MGNSEREIESLIYAYAERFDLGDLDGVAALFSDGRIQAAPGVVYEGSKQVFQASDGLPLQAIITGRYHDTFHRVNERWRFDTREMFVGLTGTLGHHLTFEP